MPSTRATRDSHLPAAGGLRRWTPALLLVLLLLGVAGAQVAPGRTLDRDKAQKVKAAYLLNFIKFASWPADLFTQPQQPLLVGVLADPEQTAVIQSTFARQQVQGHALRVVMLEASEERPQLFYEQASACQVIYVDAARAAGLELDMARLVRPDVLTVADQAGFAQAGGMLELTLEQGRYVFIANAAAIRASRVKLETRLLQLARQVVGRDQE